MIRINAIPNSAAAKNYYRSENADYYLEGHEQEARWHGKGAEMLGLSGQIKERDFVFLCENLNPETGKQLTAKHIQNRRVGYDFTFSVSKSVSVLYALGADPRLADEFRGAVEETMGEMEREMSTRVRKRGMDTDRRTGNMIWADFLHFTSRPIEGVPDPQLHVHAVVFNATYDHEESQWKAGQFGGLKADAPYFQAAFRSRLANRLQRLGYEIKKGKDDFEIVGVPDRVVKEFSRRTNLIEKKAEELGVTRPETKAKLGATTREAKTDGLTWDDLLRLWKNRLRPGEMERIEGAVKAANHSERILDMVDRSREAVDWALRHLLERSSVVSQREAVTQALRHGLGEVTPEAVLKEIVSRKDLIRRDVMGVEQVTTQGVLAEETAVMEWAKKGRGRWRPLQTIARDSRVGMTGEIRDLGYPVGSAQGPLSPSNGHGTNPTTLSPTQASAVKHALTSNDRVILIRGAAGSGKTTLTKAILAGVDVPFVVLAPSAEASRGVLRREKVDPNADTLAKFLLDEDMQARVKNGLIVLDEASLAGAHDVAKLVKAADSLGARLLFLGDRRQHRSVSRGDVLALLEDKAGLPVATVGEIRRQAGEYREAVKLASEGHAADALQKLDEMGWVKEGHDALVADYLSGLKDGKTQIVVAPTHAEGDAVTAKLREALKHGGRRVRRDSKETPVLSGEEHKFERLENVQLTEAERTDPETLKQLAGSVVQFVKNVKGIQAGDRVTITPENAAELAKQGSRFVVYRKKELPLAAGDTVRFTANDWDVTGKHRLNNGTVYQVGGFEEGKLRLSNGWLVDASKPLHLTHGYVSTSFAAQGRTSDRVLIAMGEQSLPAVDRATTYVAMSRGRQAAYIYANDKGALLDAAERERPHLLATELVRQPKGSLAKRKKRAIAFMRELTNKFRHKEPEKEQHKERQRD